MYSVSTHTELLHSNSVGTPVGTYTALEPRVQSAMSIQKVPHLGSR